MLWTQPFPGSWSNSLCWESVPSLIPDLLVGKEENCDRLSVGWQFFGLSDSSGYQESSWGKDCLLHFVSPDQAPLGYSENCPITCLLVSTLVFHWGFTKTSGVPALPLSYSHQCLLSPEKCVQTLNLRTQENKILEQRVEKGSVLKEGSAF